MSRFSPLGHAGLALSALLASAAMLAPVAARAAAPGFNLAPAEPTRVRATGPGSKIGVAAGIVAGLVASTLFCRIVEEGGPICRGPEDALLVGVVIGLPTVAAFSLFGALVGTGLPVRQPAGYRPAFWEHAEGEIGVLSLHLGATRVTGGDNRQLASPAGRLSFLVKLGPYLALGPELGYYPQRRLGHTPPEDRDHQSVALAGAVRAGAPLGAFYPYLLAGYGYHTGGLNEAGALAAGGEWRWRPNVGVGGELRLTGDIDGTPTPFMTVTAAVSWHW